MGVSSRSCRKILQNLHTKFIFYIKYKLVTEFWKNTCYFCDVKWRYLNWNEILGNAGLVVPPLVVAEAEMNIDFK